MPHKFCSYLGYFLLKVSVPHFEFRVGAIRPLEHNPLHFGNSAPQQFDRLGSGQRISITDYTDLDNHSSVVFLLLQPIRHKEPLAVDEIIGYFLRWKNTAVVQAAFAKIDQQTNGAACYG